MISNRIRQLRRARGLTLEQLATELGVTKASVSKWELGSTHPEHSRLDQLARVLGVTAPQLLTDPGASPVRSYPVVEYRKYDRVEYLMDRLRSPRVKTYPSQSPASGRAFFMSFDDREQKNLWLTGIQLGSLILFDPEQPYTTDDLILARKLAFGLVGVYDHDEAQRILSMTPGPEGNNAQKAPRTGGAKRNKTPMGVDALREHLVARQA